MELVATGELFKREAEREEEKMKRLEGAGQTAFRQAKETFKAQAFSAAKPVRQFGKASGNTLSYGVGDRVRHIKFGEGTVKSIVEGGRDYEVAVDFDKAGVKKMFAGFAKLERISDES